MIFKYKLWELPGIKPSRDDLRHAWSYSSWGQFISQFNKREHINNGALLSFHWQLDMDDDTPIEGINTLYLTFISNQHNDHLYRYIIDVHPSDESNVVNFIQCKLPHHLKLNLPKKKLKN
jgi:hypothetical protein